MNKKVFLTIGGSDPIGGAGIQADLKTADRLGLYGCSVITCITAQNSCGVSAVTALDPSTIERQLIAVLEDLRPDAVKIGLIPDPKAITLVGKIVNSFKLTNIVLDPVLAPTHGRQFLEQNMTETLLRELLPLVSILTPNLPEAEILTNITRKPLESMCSALLLKGGHQDSRDCEDILYLTQSEGNQRILKFSHPKLKTSNTHGTGCVLSSAIASFLAYGNDLESAVRKSIDFVFKALVEGKDYTFGKCGYGPTLF